MNSTFKTETADEGNSFSRHKCMPWRKNNGIVYHESHSTKTFTGEQYKFYNVLTFLRLIFVHNAHLKLTSPSSR